MRFLTASLFAALVAMMVGGVWASGVPAQEAGSFESEVYEGRTYKIYVPGEYTPGGETPLVVMLHGCTQDPDQFAAGTRMNEVAEREGFIVIYPEQTSSQNSSECWNWFEPAHQSRGSGEPALIAGMVDDVKGDYSVDDDRVYASGLSAGGAMAVIMGATYPDVFAAIEVGAGLEYKAATSQVGAFTALNSGGPDPERQGDAAYAEMGANARPVPTIVFHGTSDYTVDPVNARQVISQWAQTNDRAFDGSDDDNVDDTAERTIEGSVPGGRDYTRSVYEDNATDDTVMEKYMVDGMGHAWSGGSTAGSYTDPQGPDASEIGWRFFENHPKVDAADGSDGGGDEDNTAPTTTASPAGGRYDSPQTVELSVDEPATTYYTLDGREPTASSAVYSEPVEIREDATLKFFSEDSAGNQEAVKTQTYTIEETSRAPGEFISIAQEDGFVGQFGADGLSTGVHKLGDKGMYNTDTYRTVLSFDTGALPDSAQVTEAKLHVYRSSLSGNVESIGVDLEDGTFGGRDLEQSDYDAPASAPSVASLDVPASDGAYAEVDLPPEALESINTTGRTQVRLETDTTADFASDVLEIYGGESGTYAPRLIVYR